ncbi:unnamed protein product [Urochloa decumbens]|uniref:Strictosidine synthase conserved region domain-containing protein n=1 Tax=Urochloa decumbens TaxID=240449 RepID=A0ABC9C2X8_9POAL
MKRFTSRLPLLATLLAVILLPSAAAATVIAMTQRLELPDMLVGPESVAFDMHGGWTTFAYSPSYTKNNCGEFSELPITRESSCGRPLGLRFHVDSGDLYIADAYMGLMRVGPNGGEAEVLATEANGKPMRLTNSVDIDQVTGNVYFTDSSTTYTRAQHEMVTKTRDSTGRVMKYDPRTSQVTVLQSDLMYPNGVAISADRTHLVVALTGQCKLIRWYWIQGPKANTSESFADLPGYPDNVRPDGKGDYWVALNREKFESPHGFDRHLLAVKIGADCKRLQEMKGPKNVRPAEVVERDDGKIYFGSIELSYVGIINT